MKPPVRIGNCSGFYGDRIEAAREMVDGGPIDVLTGDYLAELTMLILWKARQKDPAAGYARTFLTQLEQVLGSCLDRGIKIVSNAGGLNPAGLAARIGDLAARLRHVAHLGISTLPFTFRLNARAVPVAPVRVELTGPDEQRWTWGPAGAADRVTGPALDFCLAVTQRRHLDDLALTVTGPVATEWMSIAQAFAGPPGPGRQPGMAVPGSIG